MVDKLDACPFCGRDGQIANTEWGSFAAGCLTKNCPAEKGAYDFVSAETAAAHWNTRATPANGEQVKRADREVVSWIAAYLRAGNTEAAFQAAAKHRAATPTEDARSRVKVLEEALERAKHKLGHVSADCMNGDNLAITLCTHFDDGEGDEDEHGWTEAASAGCDATLEAIHAMYADVLRTALGNKETDRHG